MEAITGLDVAMRATVSLTILYERRQTYKEYPVWIAGLSSREFDLPFFPRKGDLLAITGYVVEVVDSMYECDECHAYAEAAMKCYSEEQCRGLLNNLLKHGWTINDASLDYQHVVYPADSVVRKPKQPSPDPPIQEKPPIGCGLDFSKIAQIMKDTEKTSQILRDAME